MPGVSGKKLSDKEMTVQPEHPTITFLPGGRTAQVSPETTLAEAAVRSGVLFMQDCGGQGTCGKCRMELVSGTVTPATQAEQDHRKDGHLNEKEVLACQRRPLDHVTLFVDAGAAVRPSAEAGKGIVPDGGHPPVLHMEKLYRELKHPSLDDQTPDWERLRQSLPRDVAVTPGVIGTLPELLRKHDFKVTAVAFQDRIITVEGGDTTALAFGIALDVGTTTVAGYLADLRTGTLLDSLAVTNRQVSVGADVMTRIAFALEHRDGLAQLQGQVVASINEILDALLARNGIATRQLYLLTAAGNTVMSHLLLGISPVALAHAPFIPAFRCRLTVPTHRLRLKAPAHARLLVLPNIASYVGSDIAAAILATEMDRSEGTRLLIDIGTNGEIVLAKGPRLVTCSTAAGPAFEGAGIRHGMRAEAGAIVAVRMEEDVRLFVVGGGVPRGICGSGLVDTAAELIRLGIIDRGGRICGSESCPGSVPLALRRRLRKGKQGNAFLLADDEAGIALHQEDVRALQLAKGAIRAGIEILLDRWGLSAADLDEVLLAGAFGSGLRVESVLGIGLLPPLTPEKIRPVGNAAGLGAWLTLISLPQWDRAAEIAAGTEHVELSGHPAFQSRFIDGLGFPAID
jgi:uncharacterized 2Fe-2S/4Fe-4S cluster protein (DUF4445 family)